MAFNADVVKNYRITSLYYVSISVSVRLLKTYSPISEPDLHNSHNF